jgi:hypothetical protein
MIQAKDLRIGIWAEFELYGIKQIRQIENTDFEFISDNELRCADPIPLTEEWHLKFGAEKERDEVYCYTIPTKRNINIVIRFNGMDMYMYQGDDRILFWDCDYTLRGMYVHEWQNLFNCLTGEELTIKN